jgi:hypothetical protein
MNQSLLRNFKIKTILMLTIASLMLVQNVFALQEVAGPLVISTPIGGSNSARWGLINDGAQTITVSLNATGDAAKYLSFPATVDLVPHKTVYVNITANIPANYNLVQNITGTLSALQQGASGQVQINVQLTKSVTISVTGESAELQQNSITGISNQVSQITGTGFAALFAGNNLALGLLIVLIFIVVIFIAFAFFVIKKFKQFPSKP